MEKANQKNPLSGWITTKATVGFPVEQLAQCRRVARRVQKEQPEAELRGILGAVFDIGCDIESRDDESFHGAVERRLADDPHGERWFGPLPPHLQKETAAS